MVEVSVTDDTRTIRSGQVGVYGAIEPDRDLSWQELSPGRFASTPVPFDTLGSFRVRVEAHFVDLPPGADLRVVENVKKHRAQIADMEAKIAEIESQPGEHGSAARALRAALENRRAALRRLLATLGGYAETATDFVVFGVPLVLSGDRQTGTAGSKLASPLVVGLARVDRTTRLAVSGIAFQWSADSGTFDGATTFTGASGETSNLYTLASSPGAVSMCAGEEIGGQTGPRLRLTAIGEEEPPALEDEVFTEMPLDLAIPSDGRTAVYQRCIMERGNDLLPMIVQVVHPDFPGRKFPLVPVAFEVIEGTGHFLHVDGLAIYSNGQGEAGLYFIPTSPGRNTVRARVFREASAETEPAYFHFEAQSPKLTDETEELVPVRPGSALDRPFRVRATGLGDNPLEREVVRFELGEDAPPGVGSFTSETSITDSQGFAESSFIVAMTAIPPGFMEPLTVPVKITLLGFTSPDGSPVEVDTTFEIRPLVVTPDFVPAGVFIYSGNGAVGHKKFLTRGAPLRVLSSGGAGVKINFAVIDGRGTIEPETGEKVDASALILEKFPDRGITEGVPAGKTRMLTLQPTLAGEAAVSYEAADDEHPGIIAVFLDTEAIDTPPPVYGAVAPPDVRIVSLDGRPLGGIAPADPWNVNLERDGFLLEARLPVGFDLEIEGRLATLTRREALAENFPEAAAPVALPDPDMDREQIVLSEVTQGIPDGLSSIWRSDADRPFVATLDTFLDPAERPPLSDQFRALQIPNHGWILPKAILVGEEENQEGARVADLHVEVKQMYFYDGKGPTETHPPSSATNPEAPRPILVKHAARLFETGDAAQNTEDLVPVVYSLEVARPPNEDYFQWSLVDPSGTVTVLKQTVEPRLHLWIQDDPNSTTTDQSNREPDDDDQVTPAILGITEGSYNIRATRRIRVEAIRDVGDARTVMGVGEMTVMIATRRSKGLGRDSTLESKNLATEFDNDFVVNFPGEDFFTDPPSGANARTDQDLEQLARLLDPRSIDGRRLLRWQSGLKMIGLSVTDYWKAGNPRFATANRLLWLGQSDKYAALTIGEHWGAGEIGEVLRGQQDILEQRALHSYGVAVTKPVVVDDADLANAILCHERLHVMTNRMQHGRSLDEDRPLDFPPIVVPERVVEDPLYAAVLLGRSMEALRAAYVRAAHEVQAEARLVIEWKTFATTWLHEVGPYANLMRWAYPYQWETALHPCRKSAQGPQDPDSFLASFYFCDMIAREFIEHYCGAVLYSFEPPHGAKITEETYYPPLFLRESWPQELQARLLDFFSAVFDVVTHRWPALYGAVMIGGYNFKNKLENRGRDVNNPWVIYRPFVGYR